MFPSWIHAFPMRKLVFPRITRSEYVNGNIKETCFRNVFACFRKCYHKVTFAETLVSFNGNSTETYKKVVRFRCNRSDGNMSKRDVSASVNMCKPSCFRDGVTCLRNVSVCGFLFYRPQQLLRGGNLFRNSVSHIWSMSHAAISAIKPLNRVRGGGGGGGGQGVWISRFPYLVLPVHAPFLSGSLLCVLFLLRNIAQCCEFIFYSSQLPPPWVSRLPPSLLPPPVHFLPPLLPGSHRPVPPPQYSKRLSGYPDNLLNTDICMVKFNSMWHDMIAAPTQSLKTVFIVRRHHITVNSLLAITSRKRPPPVSDHFAIIRFLCQSNTVSKTLP